MEETADVEMSVDDISEISTGDLSTVKELTKKIVEKWRDRFAKGTITSTHFEYGWRVWVPKIYSPSLNESCLNWNFNEELAQEVLFNTLDEFICDGDPNIVLKQLSELDKSPSVCGKVFKYGEPTYACRECGMDKTCVLCVECFKNSEHRLHKYKMATSYGGGCCDCGDTEAWSKDVFCKIHIAGVSQVGEQKKDLPEDVKERTRIVFEAAIWYAYRLLSTEQVADIRLGGVSDNFFDIDTYCTILYNDEIHTFEQVINTLTRVLKCNQRSSTEFVTNIDREGRAIVKCASFQHCSDLKQEIEKYTSRHGNKPLKVLVNHAYVIAHQIYAMKLLTWLEKYLALGERFRAIFAEVVLKQQAMEPSIIKGIMQRDSTLWKSARSQWQRLLISGMLLEYENKKALAKIFTKHYGQVMKDFIKDDHDHAFSIASLSVQLFTVPTLAHYLIAYEDVLYILLNALISECSRKCNKAGKLEFERSPSSQTFKRSLYILYDLNYLLSAVPTVWTDDLRRSFLHGLSMMLSLLTMMQGMDAVTRQVGQHMEYEPEWESGFNLHMKLSHSISLIIDWCGTDKVVLVKAYRSVLKKLEENPCYEPSEAGDVRELADHGTACLHYDVSSKPVSIHLPLSRFLAGLHLHLERFGLHFDGTEFQVTKPTPVQIMEPVLRAHVMIAQVHAGMWRRNGYALLNTLYFYHNVKCRAEMLDRDITLLQIAASLIESNEFLIHVLNRFNLINWAMPEVGNLKSPEEDSIRQTIGLVEELLHFLIVIIGERYMPGVANVTVKDRIKKEIIQHLCVKPLPHSELIKTIPDDLTSRDVAIDEIIQELAVFKKPTHGAGKGVYELKDQYYDDFNVFFYHYTKEDQSKSDEAQRKRHKDKGELECCPPPKLLKLNESFSLLVNLLQCDVMLHIMKTVLQRSITRSARNFSEPQLHKVLHLIGYALLEQESKNYPFFKFIENSTKYKIFTTIEQVLKSTQLDSHKGLLQWVYNKYKQLSDKKGAWPILQREPSTMANDDMEKERRSKLAAERRAKLMAQMQTMQNNFIKDNASLFDDDSHDRKTRTSIMVETMDTNEIAEEEEEEPVALGPNQSPRVPQEKTVTCILCQEEEKIAADGPTMVLAAFVQQATVLCQHKNSDVLMDVTRHDPLYLNANLGPAPHTSTCGHVMHSDCWRKYFDNIMVREHRRPYRLRHPTSFDVDKQEFLCPLCECLSNTVLPLLPSLTTLQPTPPKSTLTFDAWLENISQVVEEKEQVCHGIFKCDASDKGSEECKNKHCSGCIYASKSTNIEHHVDVDCEVNCMLQPHQVFCSYELGDSMPEDFKELFPTNCPVLDETYKDMIQVFTQVTYKRGLNVNPHPSDKRLAPMAWKSLAYTIHSIDVLLRDMDKPLLGSLSSRHRDCIESLVRIVATLGSTWQRSVFVNSHAVDLLTKVIEHADDGPSILRWDSFGLLVSLTFALPSLSCKYGPTPVPTGGTSEWHLLRLVFACHVVKVLALSDSALSMDTDTSCEDATLTELMTLLGRNDETYSAPALWDHVRHACRHFLRCCVLFYHFLSETQAPLALTERNCDSFDRMCEYLDLPLTFDELFDSRQLMALVGKWAGHTDVVNLTGGADWRVVGEPLRLPRLVDLHEDYSELINSVSTFRCPNSEEDSKNPCMCLVCGEVLCSQSYCCQTEVDKVQVGACNYHASKCGAGVGIFLRVRECEILFLAAPHRGCSVPPPYLDAYGETDQGLRRGNPLTLCPERYRKLQSLWLAHSIHEEIARSIETSNHIVATHWNLL